MNTKPMKSRSMKVVLLVLLVGTLLTIALFPLARGFAFQAPPKQLPMVQASKPLVEAVFVLDTTGSMGGMIETAKEKIWSIAATMAAAQPAPEIKIGLVAYRDRGDEYITRTVDLSSDLDSVYGQLMQLQAMGGGDGPESVNKALADAIQKLSWSTGDEAYKVIFLVGDAPPHMDYQDEMQFPEIVQLAKQRNILINTIQCGEDPATQNTWRQIAALSQGSFFNVAQAGGGVQLATPFDEQLADLSRRLDQTKVFYGSEKERAAMATKQAAAETLYQRASPASVARRAEFNSSSSGKKNLYGEHELLEALAANDRTLEELEEAGLPEKLRGMSDERRKQWLKEKMEKRSELEKQIDNLAKERQKYLKQEAAKLDSSSSLDHQLYSVIKAQAGDKGLVYEEDTPRY